MPISFPQFRRVIGPDPNNGIRGDTIRPKMFNDIYDTLDQLNGMPTADEAQGALTAGDPGDIKATDENGVISNVKPGQIDIRQRGAVGDGTTDNTTLINTLVDEAIATGAELWVPEGTYVGAPTIKTGMRLNGVGTIKAPAGLSSQGVFTTHNSCTGGWSIKGITIDANNAHCGIIIWDDIAQSDILIEGVTVLNPGTTSNYDVGVRFIGVTRLTVRAVTVFGGNGAVGGYNCQFSLFEDCVGINQEGNAFGGVASGAAMPGNIWRNLRAVGCERMGIELFGQSGGYFDGGTVEGCDFVMAGVYSGEMGYSIVALRNGRVLNNSARSPNNVSQYGYEIGGNSLDVIGNYAEGFGIGFVTNANSYCTIQANRSVGAHTGFHSVGSGANQFGHSWIANVAQSFRDDGFNIGNQSSVGSGGLFLTGNRAIRDLAWAGDGGSHAIHGFKVSTNAKTSPILVVGNYVDWAEVTPTSGQIMDGYQYISTSSGDLLRSVHRDNGFRKLNSTHTAYVLTQNGSSASVDMVTPTGNTRTNYLGVTTDKNSFDGSAWTS